MGRRPYHPDEELDVSVDDYSNTWGDWDWNPEIRKPLLGAIAVILILFFLGAYAGGFL